MNLNWKAVAVSLLAPALLASPSFAEGSDPPVMNVFLQQCFARSLMVDESKSARNFPRTETSAISSVDLRTPDGIRYWSLFILPPDESSPSNLHLKISKPIDRSDQVDSTEVV